MVLAIESTGRTGSLALVAGGQILRRINLDTEHRTAATLAPEVAGAIEWCRDQSRAIRCVAVASGPGSFTGLRIAVTTAKTLAYALDLPLVSVDSLASVAAEAMRVSSDVDRVLVAIDAYRGQVFCGQFDRERLMPPPDRATGDGQGEEPSDWTAHPDCVVVEPKAAFLSRLSDLPDGTCLAGEAKCFVERAVEASGVKLLDRQCDAIGVGLLAEIAMVRRQFTDPMELLPRYLKASAAEEKAALGRD